MALCLAAGLDGIKRKLKPVDPIYDNLYDMSDEELKANNIEMLPKSLEEAIKESVKDPFVRETVGEHVFEKYIEGKKSEWREYSIMVSQWEINNYLIKY